MRDKHTMDHFGMMDHFGPSYFPVHCRIGLLLESVALQIIIQACMSTYDMNAQWTILVWSMVWYTMVLYTILV